jgi:hypothetical protein
VNNLLMNCGCVLDGETWVSRCKLHAQPVQRGKHSTPSSLCSITPIRKRPTNSARMLGYALLGLGAAFFFVVGYVIGKVWG